MVKLTPPGHFEHVFTAASPSSVVSHALGWLPELVVVRVFCVVDVSNNASSCLSVEDARAAMLDVHYMLLEKSGVLLWTEAQLRSTRAFNQLQFIA